MGLEVGSVFEGKVTGITNFGAFVSLPEGKSGMVHISEVSQSYVNNIREHLEEGQQVKVKVIGIDEEGRINLSIKKAQEPVRNVNRGGANNRRMNTAPAAAPAATSFEDKLKQFMQESENRMSDLRAHTESRRGRGRR